MKRRKTHKENLMCEFLICHIGWIVRRSWNSNVFLYSGNAEDGFGDDVFFTIMILSTDIYYMGWFSKASWGFAIIENKNFVILSSRGYTLWANKLWVISLITNNCISSWVCIEHKRADIMCQYRRAENIFLHIFLILLWKFFHMYY